MTTLAILGGSSPFVIDLIDGLAPLGHWRIRLHGRDGAALAAIAGYARHALDAESSVEYTTDLAAALDGADIVIHQIRYGGLAGRDFDERLAVEIGVAADETLGPSGLHSAIRMAAPLLRIAETMKQWCPEARVVNLTNPLSCSTALLSGQGLWVIGLCELPDATLRDTCTLLEVAPERVAWDYIGLNHRGFIQALALGGQDMIADLPRRMGARTIGGISGEEIAALGAIPLKYFRLFLDPAAPRHVGRAGVVSHLRNQALVELAVDPRRRPPSLEQRATPWYADAVVPLLRTWRTGEAGLHVVNVAGGDGLVRETRAVVQGRDIRPLPMPPAVGAVGSWMRRFEAHERALVAAALDPTAGRVKAALAADPMLHPDHVRLAAFHIGRAIAGASVDGRAHVVEALHA